MYWPENPFEKNPQLYDHLKKDYINTKSVSEFGIETCESRHLLLMKRLCIPPAFTTVRLGLNVEPQYALQEILQCTVKKGLAQHVTHHPMLPDLLLVKSPRLFPDFAVAPQGQEVVVDLRCGEAVLRGAPVFAAGVLGAPSGLSPGDDVSLYVDLDGKCLKGSKKTFEGRKVFIGNGKSVVSRAELFKATLPRGIAVNVTERVCDCPTATDLNVGILQNLPSVVCAHVLDARPFQWVIDMCAAPGGKTAHIGTLMNNKGIVVALDKSQSRMKKLRETISSSGLTCVHCFLCDSTNSVDNRQTADDAELFRRLSEFSEENEARFISERLHPPYPPQLFDRVLLDAPCSGLGRRPQLCNKMTVAEVSSYPPLQRKLFSEAVRLLRVGGNLVYSTCTLTLAENEDVVRWALEEFPELSLEEQVPSIGGPGMPCTNLPDSDRMKLQRFESFSEENFSVNTDTVGFFISKFVKNVSV